MILRARHLRIVDETIQSISSSAPLSSFEKLVPVIGINLEEIPKGFIYAYLDDKETLFGVFRKDVILFYIKQTKKNLARTGEKFNKTPPHPGFFSSKTTLQSKGCFGIKKNLLIRSKNELTSVPSFYFLLAA